MGDQTVSVAMPAFYHAPPLEGGGVTDNFSLYVSGVWILSEGEKEEKNWLEGSL